MRYTGLLRSFRHAGRGLARTAREERNLRIHLTALCYAVWAGCLAELDAGRWAAVLLCCGAVISAELFNTALERLCDALHPAEHPKIGAAKDAAAGAVLALAAVSLGVGVAVFAPWIFRGGLVRTVETHSWVVPLLLLSLLPAILWIRGRKKWTLKNRA